MWTRLRERLRSGRRRAPAEETDSGAASLVRDLKTKGVGTRARHLHAARGGGVSASDIRRAVAAAARTLPPARELLRRDRSGPAFICLLDSYLGIETFPVVIRMLPGHLLDEDKINLLSRDQVQRVLMDKVVDLQDLNTELSQQNTELEDVQSAKQMLESAVAERTRELESANRRLSASLEEKELLLKEIHHRVKNNLQIVSSMLSLPMPQITEPRAREVLAESQSRIRSMALIQEKLYKSQDLVRIDFDEYLSSLCAEVMNMIGGPQNGIQLITRVEHRNRSTWTPPYPADSWSPSCCRTPSSTPTRNRWSGSRVADRQRCRIDAQRARRGGRSARGLRRRNDLLPRPQAGLDTRPTATRLLP